MSESYTALGGWFEYLNADCDYLKWSQYLLDKLKAAGDYKTGLDIGCGNGYFTRAFNRAGYSVSGMDISASMLSQAKRLAAKEGVRCEFLSGDITKLKVCAKVDFCTAVNDCINYVPKTKLKSAFARVYAALNANGAFLFDISSENKIRNILGENLFGEDGEIYPICGLTGRRTTAWLWSLPFSSATRAGCTKGSKKRTCSTPIRKMRL